MGGGARMCVCGGRAVGCGGCAGVKDKRGSYLACGLQITTAAAEHTSPRGGLPRSGDPGMGLPPTEAEHYSGSSSKYRRELEWNACK